MKQQILDILSKHTGKSIKKIEKDIELDYFMGPEEAIEYGLIDKIIEQRVGEKNSGK